MTETLLAFFKAMADESCLRIIGLLAQGERSVQQLAQALELREPTVSHHLAVLKAQGLVTVRGRRRGRRCGTAEHALDRAALGGLLRAAFCGAQCAIDKQRHRRGGDRSPRSPERRACCKAVSSSSTSRLRIAVKQIGAMVRTAMQPRGRRRCSCASDGWRACSRRGTGRGSSLCSRNDARTRADRTRMLAGSAISCDCRATGAATERTGERRDAAAATR